MALPRLWTTDERLKAATTLAPFVMPRLQATQLTGKDERALEVAALEITGEITRMAVFKPKCRDKDGMPVEPNLYWYEFIYAGKRVRESAKTTRKTIAVEAEKQCRLRLERAHAGLPVEAPSPH